MYFPYLHGRRSELLALRAVLNGEDRASLLPVIEPVNSDIGDLRRCVTAYGSQAARIAVIDNPGKHQLAPPRAAREFRSALGEIIEEFPSVVPAMLVAGATSMDDVVDFLERHGDRQVALIYWNPTLDSRQMRSLAGERKIAFHIVVAGRLSAALQREIPVNRRVDVENAFNKLTRNADYGGPEFFSDLYKSVPAERIGVGDFTVLPAAFEPGGGQPAAIALHATYLQPGTRDVWVEHFLSDQTNAHEGDVASKFLQAARKVVRAARRRQAEFGDDIALSAYEEQVRTSSFPGLPKNKEQQIIHHICLMLSAVEQRT